MPDSLPTEPPTGPPVYPGPYLPPGVGPVAGPPSSAPPVAPPDRAPGGAGPRTLTWGDVVAGLGLGLVVPMLVLVAWLVVTAWQEAPLGVVLLGVPVFGLMSLGLVAWWFGAHRRLAPAALGLRRFELPAWMLVWVTPLLMVAAGTLASLGRMLLGEGPDAAGEVPGVEAGVPWPVVALSVLTVCVAAPVVEEIVFRGVLLGRLRERFGTGWAVAGSSVAFALAHVSPSIMVYVLPLGIGLALVRVRFGTVWAGVVVHAVNNAVVTAVALAALG